MTGLGAQAKATLGDYDDETEDAGDGTGAGAQADEEGYEAMTKKRSPHIGSGLDDFLKEEGTFEEQQVQAIKEVVAWQLGQAMKKKRVSKNGLAKMLRTNRLLDPARDVTLSSLQRAAVLVGRQVRLELL